MISIFDPAQNGESVLNLGQSQVQPSIKVVGATFDKTLANLTLKSGVIGNLTINNIPYETIQTSGKTLQAMGILLPGSKLPLIPQQQIMLTMPPNAGIPRPPIQNSGSLDVSSLTSTTDQPLESIQDTLVPKQIGRSIDNQKSLDLSSLTSSIDQPLDLSQDILVSEQIGRSIDNPGSLPSTDQSLDLSQDVLVSKQIEYLIDNQVLPLIGKDIQPIYHLIHPNHETISFTSQLIHPSHETIPFISQQFSPTQEVEQVVPETLESLVNHEEISSPVIPPSQQLRDRLLIQPFLNHLHHQNNQDQFNQNAFIQSVSRQISFHNTLDKSAPQETYFINPLSLPIAETDTTLAPGHSFQSEEIEFMTETMIPPQTVENKPGLPPLTMLKTMLQGKNPELIFPELAQNDKETTDLTHFQDFTSLNRFYEEYDTIIDPVILKKDQENIVSLGKSPLIENNKPTIIEIPQRGAVSTHIDLNRDPQTETAPIQQTITPQATTAPVLQTIAPQATTAPIQQTIAPQEETTPLQQTITPQQTIAPQASATPLQQTITPQQTATPQTTTAPLQQAITPQQTIAPQAATAPILQTITPLQQAVTPQTETTPLQQTIAPQTETIPLQQTIAPQTKTTPIQQTVTPQTETTSLQQAVIPPGKTVNQPDAVESQHKMMQDHFVTEEEVKVSFGKITPQDFTIAKSQEGKDFLPKGLHAPTALPSNSFITNPFSISPERGHESNKIIHISPLHTNYTEVEIKYNAAPAGLLNKGPYIPKIMHSTTLETSTPSDTKNNASVNHQSINLPQNFSEVLTMNNSILPKSLNEAINLGSLHHPITKLTNPIKQNPPSLTIKLISPDNDLPVKPQNIVQRRVIDKEQPIPIVDLNLDIPDTSLPKLPVRSDALDILQPTTSSTGLSGIIPQVARITPTVMSFEHSVVEQVRHALTQGKHKISINLRPEHLGNMEISLTSHKGAIAAHLIVDHSATHDLLENNISLLKQTLTEQGINLEKITISTSAPSNNLNNNHQDPSNNSQQFNMLHQDTNQHTSQHRHFLNAQDSGLYHENFTSEEEIQDDIENKIINSQDLNAEVLFNNNSIDLRV